MAVAVAFATFSMNAEVVNNESIIKMIGKGYDTEIIIGFIVGAEEGVSWSEVCLTIFAIDSFAHLHDEFIELKICLFHNEKIGYSYW